ncbi:hypothetical protein KCV87_10095 [Actinosynnema pretiosum subsp. pretiosum]|uniref:Uncharacterized protein n=2 Tax=Actinosynnema TaxID=40566 RepID=C6WFM7_ACTMD|nr:hypothetical protein [Actinosynnema mirum]ACU35962.1 hypothetical protein Amir_2014 [Actinosynnema mirum DSM 43827]AXX29384.1 hypothetical protein APASM_2019 [Actinosynnema pretiosum subsp. pretiosum]QUF06368.1 hypothetical protein KCV87_10095 [Actinosynnema pretiosum subsp. pretiosum]
MRYGRSDDEWDTLAEEGRRFLVEQAELKRMTTYTEFNATIARRTGLRAFDFDAESERAALGDLLGQIAEGSFRETGGLLISALVQYLSSNDAGTGFYALARAKGLPVPGNAADRQLFWAGHVGALHKHYARPVARRHSV